MLLSLIMKEKHFILCNNKHNNKHFYETNIDLLYFESKEKNHYYWIKNLSKLLNDQLEVNRNKNISVDV